jgi:4-aminobutyrate aminotransferase
MPLSGVFASSELMSKWAPGSHGGTYGGNAVACAAAVATIRAIRDEGMLANTWDRGIQLMTGLRHLQEEHPQIADVRGLGLMIGSEFRTASGKPDRAMAKAVVHDCQDAGLLLLTCGPWDNTVRWIPPLNVGSEHIAAALQIFAGAVKNHSQ